MKKVIIFGLSILIPVLGCAVNIPKLADKTEPKVVKIGIVSETARGTCSGSFLNDKGDVLTCAHCFSHGEIKKVFIKTSDEKVHSALLLAIDRKNDLALVVLTSGRTGDFPSFNIGKTPRIGDRVFSFGSPIGIQHTFEVGYVSNVITDEKKLVIHSAAINPGNSGGPLVNEKGELVGVNEATFLVNPFMEAQGLNIAIDQSVIHTFLETVYVSY